MGQWFWQVGYTRVAPAAWGGGAMACSDDSAAFIAAMGRFHQGGECRLCPADAVDAHPVAFDRHLQVVEPRAVALQRSEEHTSELQSLMRISYAVFCLK